MSDRWYVRVVAVWPVYLWRRMHEDMGGLFAVGDVVSWDVILIDGEAEGWPSDVLVDTSVVIEERPEFALRGSLARTPQLSACWEGDAPVGSEFRIRAGLRADLLNPPFPSTVTGVVQRIQIVTRPMTQHEGGLRNRAGEWHRADVRKSPRWLARPGDDPAAEQEDGFLVGLELLSHEIRPFPERPSDSAANSELDGPSQPQR